MSRTSALTRLVAPAAARHLRLASGLGLAAGLLWPVQAAAIAWAIPAWIEGRWVAGLWAAALFLAAALIRAGLEALAARRAYRGADMVITEARGALLDREGGQLSGGVSSAALGAMVAQKLPLLSPYLTRYQTAMVRVMVLPLLYLCLVFPVSWAAGLVLLVAGPLIPVFMALVGMAAKEASDRQMAEIGDMNALLIDNIAALPDIRLLNATERARTDFAARAEALKTRTMAVLRVAFLSSTVLELFAALGVAMVAVYVGFSLLGEIPFGAYATPLTLGQGLFLLLMAPEYFQPLRDLAAAWHDRAAAQSVADELEALAARPADPILGTGGLAAPIPGPATLAMHGVVVQRGTRRLVLPEITLEPGEMVVLAGPSGAGKSTALDLAAGLLRAGEGDITVAGQALDRLTADGWRARIAYIPQAVRMPDAPLHEILDPHGRGGDMAAALQAARADHVVAALPEGLETRLGETGAGVSGGEARRLLLARAFLAGAEVILADEPTADLDHATARQVIDALAALKGQGAALLVATHDPELMHRADRVLRIGEDAA
ncbi:thiol reductant ABC exporter subunit CydD [Pseudooceanicola sp. 502str34]